MNRRFRPSVSIPEIYLYRDPIDFRKSYRGLAALVEQEIGHNPFDGGLYAFTNRQRNKIKLLFWEDNGFVLYYKALAEEKFRWPRPQDFRKSAVLAQKSGRIDPRGTSKCNTKFTCLPKVQNVCLRSFRTKTFPVYSMPKVIGLFPTPVMKVEQFLDSVTVERFIESALSPDKSTNTASELLSHTRMMDPTTDESYARLSESAAPHLQMFGEVLFAEKLSWIVKEAWMNVLETGGSQFMHTHANSFVSGIVYLTRPHTSANTIFRKSSGGGEFIFKNDVPLDHYSSDTWILSDVSPGDMLLYPSYLSHGVPPNEGGQRITIAFNAIPHRLDSLGYKIRFGA